MLLDDQDIIAVQLLTISGSVLTAITEDNQIIQIKPDRAVRADKYFWRILREIAKEKIWIPVTRRTHQLLQYDWLAPAV